MDTTQTCTPELEAQTRGPTLIGVAFGLWSLALIAVVLRLLSRHLAKVNLWWDDWVILLSLAMSAAYSLSAIPLYLEGVGKHTVCAKPGAGTFWLKTLLAWEFLYTFILVSVKYSILLFLWRLFHVRSFRKTFWFVWTIVTLWGIGVIITSALSCRPLRAFWGEGVGRCISTKKFFVGNSVPNIATDIGLLIMPIPWLLRLQMARILRLSLIGVFICGAMVVVISCYRLYILLSTPMGYDFVYDDVPEATWTIAEINVAIFCACLPSMSPLLKRVFVGAFQSQASSDNQMALRDTSRWSATQHSRGPVSASSQATDATVVEKNNDIIEMRKAWSVRDATKQDFLREGTCHTEIGVA